MCAYMYIYIYIYTNVFAVHVVTYQDFIVLVSICDSPYQVKNNAITT